MGISCKPSGKWESIMRKLHNEQIKEQNERLKKASKPKKDKQED